MKTAVISFTSKGLALSEKIRAAYADAGEILLYTKQKKAKACEIGSLNAHAICFWEGSLAEWAREQFERGNTLIFIGACGIAVRAIAGVVSDKLKDSPVLVMDELGQYVIPILSGHAGGANEIAEDLASRLRAAAVITTATDVNGKFAVDVFAKKHALTILDRRGIAEISAKILEDEAVTVSVEPKFEALLRELPVGLVRKDYPPKSRIDIVISRERAALTQAVLPLKPKEYVLGIGCKKGKAQEEIEAFIRENLKEAGIGTEEIALICSIDKKKDEIGICQWAAYHKIPYHTFSAEELRAVPGKFEGSDFVEKTVGVDNVCERSALAGCAKLADVNGETESGTLILKKQAKNGITLAAANRM